MLTTQLTTQLKFRLPHIRKVALRSFSLFTANPDAEFESGDGVLCLIGANGIGKSTLLTAINFCLTGIVSDPRRDFKSMEEYYDYSLRYSAGYFRGRILDSDSEEAEILITFILGDFEYNVKRGFFEPDELRALTITNMKDGMVVFSSEEHTRRESHQYYADWITKHIGLSSFAEYVFLQHFVFTFDERRLLLFWNQKILERVIYITFGLDPNMAKTLDDTKREFESADSQVRNKQWDATKTTKRINELRAKYENLPATQQTYEKLAIEYETLMQTYDQDGKSLEMVSKQLKDAHLRLASFSANESALRGEYAQLFDSGLEQCLPLAQHPLFIQGIANNCCRLCGSKGEEVVRGLRSKMDLGKCPLCDSSLSTELCPKNEFERLKNIDLEIAKIKKKINEALKEIDRMGKEESLARENLNRTKSQLDAFEKENEATMLLMKKTLPESEGVEALMASYRSQLEKVIDEKKDAEKRRGQLREKLVLMQRKLQQQYLAVEQDFVPAFTELAHLFLGMDLHVHMEASETSGLNLVVEVRGTKRYSLHHLSESQRFFLDIALRMAIIKFISDPAAKGSLFLDTPEGSLDIAYEKRAGDMLAKFVAAGHRVVMTANLNSSNLLLALARSCKNEHMRLCRITDWAELSDVQREEEGLFDEAYNKLEVALRAE